MEKKGTTMKAKRGPLLGSRVRERKSQSQIKLNKVGAGEETGGHLDSRILASLTFLFLLPEKMKTKLTHQFPTPSAANA